MINKIQINKYKFLFTFEPVHLETHVATGNIVNFFFMSVSQWQSIVYSCNDNLSAGRNTFLREPSLFLECSVMRGRPYLIDLTFKDQMFSSFLEISGVRDYFCWIMGDLKIMRCQSHHPKVLLVVLYKHESVKSKIFKNL